MRIRIECRGAENLPLASLVPTQGDLKELSTENYAKLKNEILSEGFSFPFFVWKRPDGKNQILDGHHRRLVLIKMEGEGYEIPDLPCATVNATDEKDAARKLLAVTSQYAKITQQGLYEFADKFEIKMDELESRFEFSDIKFDDFKANFYTEPDHCPPGEDSTPGVGKVAITKPGDIWLLGNHRVMCGDSTMIDDFEKLMNGDKADITFTSPPYNVGRTPNGNQQKYLNNSDNLEKTVYCNLLDSFTSNALFFCDYVFTNIQSLAGNKVALIEHLYNMRHSFADTIIWDKKTAEPAMSRRVLNSQFEYVHVFSNDAKRVIGKKDFRGTLSNVFELNSRQDKHYSKINKATFPLDLALHFIENFTESSCIDAFCGTGTTLIACESAGRKFFGMELDPLYCDVIIKRWQNFTGKEAILESSGEKFDSLNKDN